MPSTAVVAGAIAGVLVVAGLGIGLGVGLTRDDGDSSPTTAEDTASSEAGGDTRSIGVGVVGSEAPGAAAPGPGPAASPTDPTFAFAPTPTPTRAFGPTPAALAPMVPVGAPAPVGPALGPALSPEAVEPAEVPIEAPAPVEEIEEESGGDTSGVAPGPDGRYAVCPGFWEEREFPGQPCGVTVNDDGTVELGEYFGGFDGYFAVDPADAHESCFNYAVSKMFQQDLCETEQLDEGLSCIEPESGSCVCYGDDRENVPIQVGKWPGNEGIIKFLTDLRDEADPADFDYPQDVEQADGGGRQDNVELVTAVFEEKIVIGDNC